MFTAAATAIPILLLSLLSSVAAYKGDMTFFYPGLGSCGAYSVDSDYVVALHPTKMADKANVCFSRIRIWNPDGGRSAEATIVDTCMGCVTEESIDVSPALFQTIAPHGDGRVHGICWGGDRAGGKRVRRRSEQEVENRE